MTQMSQVSVMEWSMTAMNPLQGPNVRSGGNAKSLVVRLRPAPTSGARRASSVERCGLARKTGLRFRCCQPGASCRKSKSHETEPALERHAGCDFAVLFFSSIFFWTSKRKWTTLRRRAMLSFTGASLFQWMSLDRGRERMIGSPPPSEPDRRVSRIRLSSR